MAFAGRRIAPLFACSFHDSLVLNFRLFISRLPGFNFTPSSFKSNGTRLITTDSCRSRRWLRNNPTMLASQAEEDRRWLNPAMDTCRTSEVEMRLLTGAVQERYGNDVRCSYMPSTLVSLSLSLTLVFGL